MLTLEYISNIYGPARVSHASTIYVNVVGLFQVIIKLAFVMFISLCTCHMTTWMEELVYVKLITYHDHLQSYLSTNNRQY